MAKPTRMQRYCLFQLASMRWFGAIFAGVSVLIAVGNLPWLMRSGDPKLLANNMGGGVAFLLIGCVVFRVCGVMERRYRTHVEGQTD
jgi:hypothetical protein